MTLSEDDPSIMYVPLNELSRERSGMFQVLKENWWAVHPERGAIFYNQRRTKRLTDASPQCNSSQPISQLLTELLYPFAVVQQVPLAFVPVNPHDY